jgi:hypothetical protein
MHAAVAQHLGAARVANRPRPYITPAPLAAARRDAERAERPLPPPRRSGSAATASARGARLVAAAAPPSGDGGGGAEEPQDDTYVLYLALAALGATALVALAFRALAGGDAEPGAFVGAADAFAGGAGPDTADALGAALWATAIYFTSPIDLLLFWLGFFKSERPSDWIIYRLGAAAGLDVDAPSYSAPLPLRAAAVGAAAAGGVAVAAALDVGLGDAIWSVSSGIGVLIASLVTDASRPTRLAPAEAEALEASWQLFSAFADEALARGGRCHESEIERALGRHPAGRALGAGSRDGAGGGGRAPPRSLEERQRLAEFIRSWAGRGADRSRSGYWKGVSVKAGAAGGRAAVAALAPPPREG